ncbi:glypican-5 isoform 2-T2 [Menidia menidia]
MSRGVYPRVNCLGCVWTLTFAVFSLIVTDSEAYSCHEVRTAFQTRQVGPPQRVPETPGTDVDLLVCKHPGPSCCTRKMEESYQFAVKRETLHNIHSYSGQLEHLISKHSEAFQYMYQYLLSFSQGHLSSLLEGTFPSLSRRALPHVNQLFSSLSLYLRGANVSVEATVHQFYDNIFPLVYTQLIKPVAEDSMTGDSETSDCLRKIRHDVNPFGNHSTVMAQELAGALGAGRQLSLALDEGRVVMNATEHATLSKDCVKSLLKMVYCPHCRGLTLIKPCGGYCTNVMRGCLASVSELDQPWRRYVGLLEQLIFAMAGHHNLELAMLGVGGHVYEALLYAQIHGPIINTMVVKVCGLSTAEPPGIEPTSPEVTTSTITSSPPLPSVAPSEHLPEQWQERLAHLKRDFLLHLHRYKSFFAALPEILCEGETLGVGSSCWSGDGVVKSYTGRVVGNGLHAQRQNPEVKVRSLDLTMAEVKARLGNFIQDTMERFPQLGEIEVWEELGSGEEEGSATDCDDEDGCQSSGDSQEKKTVQDVIERTSSERIPEIPYMPSSVNVKGGSTSASRLHTWILALLFAGLCLQWMLF